MQLVIFLFTLFLPQIVKLRYRKSKSKRLHKANNWLPFMAAIVFMLAWFIPDVHLSTETQTFQIHFFGIGVYTGLLYAYFQQLHGRKRGLLKDFVFLLIWVSVIGLTVELLEQTVNHLNILNLNTSDTSWDILANTSGAVTAYITYLLIRIK